MTMLSIASATGCAASDLHLILNGDRTEINRSTQGKILSVKPPRAAESNLRIDATGARRRLQALQAIGHSIRTISAEASVSRDGLWCTLKEKRTVSKAYADKIADVYAKLAHQPGASTLSQRTAEHKGWPGPDAWDNDTIDNPDAIPEWTGKCGTDAGWRLHRTHNIPMCAPCEQAHASWLAEQKDLSPEERKASLREARASISKIYAIAQDALELEEHGYTREQAADRLGVPQDTVNTNIRRYLKDKDLEQAA